ncbi:hypothetical protein [Pseudomonas viridiflava]|uniref:hypothetical protein n=1 Tax=Pseudomonas viridiflava TaxID=33069 RepID=UPI001C312359|nr:hypothetical protein [Pseudomonas viridiflava]QXG27205.1 hypothetical protein KTT56_10295 [Pseudomonas viridiflava]QXG32891.1 hypothetical protein KTT59_13055 [Pseudomonas viridiflava]
MDFAKTYKTCKKSRSLARGLKAVLACLERQCAVYISVEEVTVDVFSPIHGYRITTLDGTAFFPKNVLEVRKDAGLVWVRDGLSTADVVLPPYYPLGDVSKWTSLILSATDHDGKMRAGDAMLKEMYPFDAIARLVVGVWSKRKTFDLFHEQLVESAKAYSLGLYGVAIVGLLPCVEGIIRKLGLLVGISVENAVGIQTLIKVFKHLQRNELVSMFDGFDWYPTSEITVDLLDGFHERVQMLESISTYLNSKLYLYTPSAPDYLTLNRHGIAHGFFHGYATQANYLRLFNLLSSLSFAAILVEGNGSMMFPRATAESDVLTASLIKCSVVKSMLN